MGQVYNFQIIDVDNYAHRSDIVYNGLISNYPINKKKCSSIMVI